MPTNPRDTYRGQSRSTNMVPFDVRHCFLLVCYSNFVPKTRRFSDIRLQKISWHWNPGQRSLKVIGTDTDRSATMLHNNQGPISYRFRDKRRFRSKIAKKFPPSAYFVLLVKGFPLELDTGVRCQKLEWWGYRAEEEVWRYLQPCGYNTPLWQTDGQTEKQTPDDSKDRAYA